MPSWDRLRGAHLFVSGGTGFVGSALLDAYVDAWDRERLEGRVTVLTRSPEAFARREPRLAHHPSIRLLPGDQADFAFPREPVDLAIHAAVTYGPPVLELERNLDGTRRILDLARDRGARRVLFTSSGAVYGPQPASLPRVPENHLGAPPLHPTSAYGEGKRASELLGLVRGEADGFDFLVARCFAFAGRRLPVHGASAIGQFVGHALRGGPIVVQGDGTPVRSYMDVRDLSEWLWTILLDGKHGRPYNVGSEVGLPLVRVAGTVRDLLAPAALVQVVGKASGGPERSLYVPSTERARTELGLAQRFTLDDAIRDTARGHGGTTP